MFFSEARNRNLPRLVCKKGEEIYGKGMVRRIVLEPAELMHFELGVMLLALSTFNSWNQRAHIFIADDMEKRFAYLIELYQAIKGKGYMDRIYDSIEGNENWADTLKDLQEEAKQNLTTYEDIVLEESNDEDNRQVEYHQVSTIQPTVNDLNRPEGISHIRTHLRYRMIKETGEILEYEPMSFDQVKVMNNTEEM